MLDHSTDKATAPIAARDVCQLLREVIFGRLAMVRIAGGEACRYVVDIDGWQISIHDDNGALDHCEACTRSDGRQWRFDVGDRFGTDPIALLSTWEHQTLERLLKAL
jgi:hypothetical protein